MSKQKSVPSSNVKSEGLEQKVWGFHAVQALFEHRPQDLVRAYLLESEVPKFGPLLKYCAKARLAYHIVKDQDLAKISGTLHHEGVCVLARSKGFLSSDDLLLAVKKKSVAGQQSKNSTAQGPSKPQIMFILDGLANPHNLGALTRSCAFLGVEHIVLSKLGADDPLPSGVDGEVKTPSLVSKEDLEANRRKLKRLPSSSLRVAEGGAEFVSFYWAQDLEELVKKLHQSGAVVLGAEAKPASINVFEWAKKSKLTKGQSVAVILGSEQSGISKKVRDQIKTFVQIPGTGAVESLNVATSGAIIASVLSNLLG